jgi:hypothetical protein
MRQQQLRREFSKHWRNDLQAPFGNQFARAFVYRRSVVTRRRNSDFTFSSSLDFTQPRAISEYACRFDRREGLAAVS